MKRKFVQAITAIGMNGYFKGFWEGRIYQGNLKSICVPGLNCYSCPGALGSCPIGSLQSILSGNLYRFSFYVMGLLILFGSTMGRFICGWLCPFGLVQELMYKIQSIKIKVKKGFTELKYLKYIVLVLFVFLLPMFAVDDFGMGVPTFCKYICPAGTLGGGIPLVLSNEYLHNSIGGLFTWKILLLLITVGFSIIVCRPFCRFLCPLGAFYSFFNPIALYRMKVEEDKCTRCGICISQCKMDIVPYKSPNSLECIRCGDCIVSCPKGAIIRDSLSDKESKKTALEIHTKR